MTDRAPWGVIRQFDRPVPSTMVEEVNRILFAPDPPLHQLAEVEICVVLGSRNCEYKAHYAARLFADRPQLLFVACGANATLSGMPEAELIRGVLLDHGVSVDQILIDEHSTNTAGNLLHAERLIGERGIDPRGTTIAIVSSGFHRRHVVANLGPMLAHALYLSAIGPNTGPETWHTSAMGRAVIHHELMRPARPSQTRD